MMMAAYSARAVERFPDIHTGKGRRATFQTSAVFPQDALENLWRAAQCADAAPSGLTFPGFSARRPGRRSKTRDRSGAFVARRIGLDRSRRRRCWHSSLCDQRGSNRARDVAPNPLCWCLDEPAAVEPRCVTRGIDELLRSLRGRARRLDPFDRTTTCRGDGNLRSTCVVMVTVEDRGRRPAGLRERSQGDRGLSRH